MESQVAVYSAILQEPPLVEKLRPARCGPAPAVHHVRLGGDKTKEFWQHRQAVVDQETFEAKLPRLEGKLQGTGIAKESAASNLPVAIEADRAQDIPDVPTDDAPATTLLDAQPGATSASFQGDGMVADSSNEVDVQPSLRRRTSRAMQQIVKTKVSPPVGFGLVEQETDNEESRQSEALDEEEMQLTEVHLQHTFRQTWRRNRTVRMVNIGAKAKQKGWVRLAFFGWSRQLQVRRRFLSQLEDMYWDNSDIATKLLILRKKLREQAEDQRTRQWWQMLLEVKVPVLEVFRCHCTREHEISSAKELYFCIVDLGLTGASSQEQQEVWQVISAAFGRAHTLEEEEEEIPEGEGVSEYDLVLEILPNIRHALEAHIDRELPKRMWKLSGSRGENVGGPLPLETCARAARLLGVDSLEFVRMVELLEHEKEYREQAIAQAAHEELSRIAFSKKPRKHSEEEPQSTRRRRLKTDDDEHEFAMVTAAAMGPDFGVGRTVSQGIAVRAIVCCRERMAVALRGREQKLKEQIYCSDEKIISMRPLLLEFYDRYQNYLENPKFCVPGNESKFLVAGIKPDAVPMLLRELGLLLSDGQECKLRGFDAQKFQDALEECDGRFTFRLLVRHLDEQHLFAMQESHEDLENIFHTHNGGKAGGLTVSEATQAMVQLGLLPMRREEQQDIMMMLVQASGASSKGCIDSGTFQALCIRVRETLGMLEYEAGLESAIILGFSVEQLAMIWEAFHNGQGNPNLIAASGSSPAVARDLGRSTTASLEPQDVHDMQDCFLDVVSTMPPPANSFVSYVRSINSPSVQQPGSRSICRQKAALWSKGVLRQALRLMRLPSDYVQSLEGQQLARVLADYFGIAVPTDATHEEILGTIGSALYAGTPEELYRKAQALGFHMAADLGWEASSRGSDIHGQASDFIAVGLAKVMADV